MLTIPPTTTLWFAAAVDPRLGFDGLANRVRTQLSADPLGGHLFVSTNRSADRVQVLYWGGHGCCLWCSRLEAGRYHSPRATAAGIELTAAQFALILDGIDGIDLSRVRRVKRFVPAAPAGHFAMALRPVPRHHRGMGASSPDPAAPRPTDVATLQLDLEPAESFVLRTVEKSYACRHCDPTTVPVGQRLRTAGPEQVGPIAEGLSGPAPLAHAVAAKFAGHVPGHPRVLEGYTGYFRADALAQYEGLYGAGEITHVRRLAHARRQFVAASDAGDERAAEALEPIGRPYAVGRALPPLPPPSDDPAQRERRRRREARRHHLRRRDAGPAWDELEGWLAEPKPGALPESPLGTAIGYASNDWAAPTRYLEAGYLAVDDNLSERTLRAIALGRNTWGVLGSEVGGRTAAGLDSVVGTCRHLGLDPFQYLREALPGSFGSGEKPTAEQLLDWLPDRWLLNRTRDQPVRDAIAG